MYVLSKEEMYKCDHYTINDLNIPGSKLMENAGKGCSLFINREIIQPKSDVLILCGHGNNGGDGFVIARYLKEWNHNPVIVMVGDPKKMSLESADNHAQCLDLEIPVKYISGFQDWQREIRNLKQFDLIIDAVFGVGFQGTIKGWLRELITEINSVDVQRIAIDIASGINADSGDIDLAFRADYTLTMAAYKYGHLLGKGRVFSGETIVINIGIPDEVFSHFNISSFLLTDDEVVYPERSKFSHKGDYGKIGIIAGSPGFSGAAVMASRSALRAGAGLIHLYHSKGMESIFEIQLLEVMTHPLPDSNQIKEFIDQIKNLDALLIGPGLGVNSHTDELLRSILDFWDKPIVVDADAINIISRNSELLPLIKGCLLTPHLGEFARLIDKSIEDVKTHRIDYLKDFVATYGCSVLLKSATTIFADQNQLIFDISGNDGLSTGGSGDVLAGIIVSFLGQKLDYRNASIAASYLLGTTAERLAEIRKPASIIPTDIIENLFRY